MSSSVLQEPASIVSTAAPAPGPTALERVPGPVTRAFAKTVVGGLLFLLAVWLGFWRCVRRLTGRGAAGTGDPRSMLLAGSFYNEGWFRSHITPLSLSTALERIVVVSDQPLFESPKVVYACPPRWLSRVVGRAAARALWVFRVAQRERCGILMGYHIMPNGLLCVAAAAMLGRRSIYQMTGGPVQVDGGGFGSENVLLRKLGTRAAWLERLMFHAVRRFDDVIVRGPAAKRFLQERGLAASAVILPGSIDVEQFAPAEEKTWDLITVGRLVPVKRYTRLLEIAALLVRRVPSLRLAFVGDGPCAAELREQSAALGLEAHVAFLGKRQDVADLLRASRAFILTSENEGLSIALIEAMACGLPAFVPPVGDLGTMLVDRETGWWIDPTDPDSAAKTIADALGDGDGWEQAQHAARDRAVRLCSRSAVAAQWDSLLGQRTRADND